MLGYSDFSSIALYNIMGKSLVSNIVPPFKPKLIPIPEEAISIVITRVRTSQTMVTLRSSNARCTGLPEHSLSMRGSELGTPDTGSTNSGKN